MCLFVALKCVYLVLFLCVTYVPFCGLNIEPEVNYIALLHDVVFAFQS